MLDNWLSPIDAREFNPNKNYTRTQFGKKLLIHWQNIPSLDRVQIAIIGINSPEADAIRKVLYQLEFPFRSLRVADLGNCRNKDQSFLIPIIKELLDGGILPIILGKGIDQSIAQFQAYHLRKYVNLVIVDEKIRIKVHKEQNQSENYLNTILSKRKPRLFNLGIIGYQSHFTSTKVLNELNDSNHEYARLGSLRHKMDEVEPIIRYADLLTFNIAALKRMEAPAQMDASPSGLFSEEACQLCKYAGLSDRLTSIGFYGYDSEKEVNGQTAQTIAQMIWYFIDGYKNRKNDYPANMDGLVEYVVEYKTRDHQTRFWKSKKSGRWWVEIPLKSKKNKTELVPCSYQDYIAACQDDFTERILNAYQKFS